MPRFARCVFAVFLAVCCLTSNLACQAAAPETAAAAFILMEAGSGRVLAARNETQERSIASTTKIMTCLVALEHSELTEKVTVKREHLREGSSMYLLEGETLTMEELLYGLMLPSGNDAGRTLVTCAERGGMRLIAVTLHDGSDWADHAALYDYGFSAYALSSGAKKGEAYGSVSVDGQSVSAVAAESFCYPVSESESLSVRAELPQTVSAPLRKGQTFGTLVISCGETEVGRVDLVSARSVQAQETKSETSKNKSLAEELWQFLSAK